MMFEFIDNSLIDRSARKKIRSYVVKDKNVGKTRLPRNKSSRTKIKITLPMLVRRMEANVPHSFPSPSRQVGTGVSLFPFPGDLTSISRDLVSSVKHAHSSYEFLSHWRWLVISSISEAANEASRYSQSVDISAPIWIQYIFLDDACTIFPTCHS